VQKVIDTLGAASDLHEDGNSTANGGSQQSSYTFSSATNGASEQQYQYTHQRLLRNPYDKVLGGVCSGMAVYFDIDPIIIRLLLVVLFFTAGIGIVAYIIAWAVIPAARSKDELYNTTSAGPVTFHDITRNVGGELQDLKRRGEQMSRELKEFFSKKK